MMVPESTRWARDPKEIGTHERVGSGLKFEFFAERLAGLHDPTCACPLVHARRGITKFAYGGSLDPWNEMAYTSPVE